MVGSRSSKAGAHSSVRLRAAPRGGGGGLGRGGGGGGAEVSTFLFIGLSLCQDPILEKSVRSTSIEVLLGWSEAGLGHLSKSCSCVG